MHPPSHRIVHPRATLRPSRLTHVQIWRTLLLRPARCSPVLLTFSNRAPPYPRLRIRSIPYNLQEGNGIWLWPSLFQKGKNEKDEEQREKKLWENFDGRGYRHLLDRGENEPDLLYLTAFSRIKLSAGKISENVDANGSWAVGSRELCGFHSRST